MTKVQLHNTHQNENPWNVRQRTSAKQRTCSFFVQTFRAFWKKRLHAQTNARRVCLHAQFFKSSKRTQGAFFFLLVGGGLFSICVKERFVLRIQAGTCPPPRKKRATPLVLGHRHKFCVQLFCSEFGALPHGRTLVLCGPGTSVASGIAKALLRCASVRVCMQKRWSLHVDRDSIFRSGRRFLHAALNVCAFCELLLLHASCSDKRLWHQNVFLLQMYFLLFQNEHQKQ